jgi:transposase
LVRILLHDVMSKRRDYEQMEERRLEGARLLGAGVSQAEVARQLGVKRQSVHEWVKVMVAQGEKGLARVPTGRKPRLNAVQLAQLAEHLQNGPQVHGYATALWTTERIAKLIHRQFGVRYHRDHVGRLLGHMGWSCQRPTGRARERKEEEIVRWKRMEWPRIKKKPKKKGAPSSSSTRAG